MTQRNAPRVKVRSVTAEFHGTEIHVDRDGEVSVYVSAQDAVDAISREDKVRGRRAMAVTVIEWSNVPAGFVPPKGCR